MPRRQANAVGESARSQDRLCRCWSVNPRGGVAVHRLHEVGVSGRTGSTKA